MNLILLHRSDYVAENVVRLHDARFKQIHGIHQSNTGDSVRVGEINGLIGIGVIREISNEFVELDISLDREPPKKLPLTVILALPRPKMLKRIFRTVAELGINELVVINSFKVEKSFWNSPALNEDKVNDYLIAGLQQAKDTVTPKVSFERRFKPFVEDTLPGYLNNSKGLVAHPAIGNACDSINDQAVTLAIGPEGGFTEYEVNKFLEAGCAGVHLGDRILRVENAITALVSKLY